jgi:hypothetical protein
VDWLVAWLVGVAPRRGVRGINELVGNMFRLTKINKSEEGRPSSEKLKVILWSVGRFIKLAHLTLRNVINHDY